MELKGTREGEARNKDHGTSRKHSQESRSPIATTNAPFRNPRCRTRDPLASCRKTRAFEKNRAIVNILFQNRAGPGDSKSPDSQSRDCRFFGYCHGNGHRLIHNRAILTLCDRALTFRLRRQSKFVPMRCIVTRTLTRFTQHCLRHRSVSSCEWLLPASSFHLTTSCIDRRTAWPWAHHWVRYLLTSSSVFVSRVSLKASGPPCISGRFVDESFAHFD